MLKAMCKIPPSLKGMPSKRNQVIAATRMYYGLAQLQGYEGRV